MSIRMGVRHVGIVVLRLIDNVNDIGVSYSIR